MELTHAFDVPASVEQTWSTFMDLERVGGCFPGATVDSVTDDSFTGSVKVKLGPIALVYAGAGRFVERDDAAHRAVIEASGKDKRDNGTAGATVTVQLSPGDGVTHVEVGTDLAITGKPAQFGRGVMQDVSDKLLGQFVGCIETQLGAAGGDSAGAQAGSPSPAASADASASAGSAGTGSVASGSVGTAGASATAASGAASGAPVRRPAGSDDSLDLGRTVLPVIAKSYAPYAVAGLVGLVLGWLLGRRR